MSFSDATSQDISGDSISSTISSASSVALFHPPLVLDPRYALDQPLAPDPIVSDSALLPQLSKHNADGSPKASSDQFDGTTLGHLTDDEIPLLLVDKLEGDDGNDEDFDALEDIALLLSTRKRNRAPPPGAQRVHKPVRVRKSQSSSKRRTKKHTLRVQLKESARIEEEMAELRGRKKKGRSVSERRYPPIDPGQSSRGPSGLRFSENCYSDPEDPEGSMRPGKPRKNSDVSMVEQTPKNHDSPIEAQTPP